ncbi:glycosaminoglycan xylosylkinase isoform X1 [Nasonia vitripennis]|uniref:FAM20 C-terminal domain-containing protein n=2 Tax=Nasonia vitripennis TaxID=7425 RepID=A0A7M7QKS4_NASVI|nr:glycosaminoglycan xylosylkinase isoform X1 [Nasonia vitripennis]
MRKEMRISSLLMFRRNMILMCIGLLLLLTLLNIFNIWATQYNTRSDKKIRSYTNKNNLKKKEQHLKSHGLKNQPLHAQIIQEEIKKSIYTLPLRYFERNLQYKYVLENIINELNIDQNLNSSIIDKLSNWPNSRQLVPSPTPELGTVIEFLRSIKITHVDNAKLGTQLKLMITFENGLKALFKPQWYKRTTKISGLVYYGKDRHNAEVVAFYLALLLSFRRIPLALIRKLKLNEEIKKNASPELLATIFTKYNDTCIYGVCHYCSSAEPICGIDNILEGSVILWLPSSWRLIKYKHPWQRTYSESRLARWEVDMNYCGKVQRSKIYSLDYSIRLLDLIDVAIFDFLMDNGDRHHYEILKNNDKNSAILLIDNGKSLGNPDLDHIDILAPLYQCCLIRKATWKRLQLFSGGSLGYALNELLAHESSKANVLPLITNEHLNAIERRLLTVFGVVEFCIHKNQYPANVIID